MPPASVLNERSSMDFMSGALFKGRRIRVFTFDSFSKVNPAIEADFSFPGRRVVEILEWGATTTGQLPKVIYMENEPEFVGKALDEWAHHRGVKLTFSRPGKLTQSHTYDSDNALIEAFSSRLPEECLSQNWFLSLKDAREKMAGGAGIGTGAKAVEANESDGAAEKGRSEGIA